MKVLHVAANLTAEWGGPTQVITNLTKALSSKGVEITIYSPVRRGEEVVRPEGTNIKLFNVDYFDKWWIGYSREFRNEMERAPATFDLVHIHEMWHYSHYAASMAFRKESKPYIITLHGELNIERIHNSLKKKMYLSMIQKKILNKAAWLHTITDKETLQAQSICSNRNISKIPNGVDFDSFLNLPDKNDILQYYPSVAGKKVLLFLGRINKIKGLDILVKAFGQLACNRDDLCLIIAGPDNDGYKTEIVQLINDYNVSDKVIFTGMISGHEKMSVLTGSDLFILPSYSEGFSISILEAMACGLPVIISNECNFPEVDEFHCGITIEHKDNKLKETIQIMLQEPDRLKVMGNNARKLVKKKYTWDRIADDMLSMYELVARFNYRGGRGS